MTRADLLSPRASLRIPSRLIAGISRLTILTRSQTAAPATDWAVHTRRDALKAAFALLTIWLLGMVGVYRVGDLAHIFLLVGLMLLLLAVLKARDAEVRSPGPRTED